VRVFWRNGTRLSGRSRGILLIVVPVAVGVGAAALMGAAQAGGPAGGTGTAVVYHVSAARQRAALAYWTPTRIAAVRLAAIAQAPSAPDVTAPKGIPSAVHFTGVPTVGALFATTGNKAHFCTASVVDSPLGDVLVAAAHCVFGTAPASNIVYVPEYHNGHVPYDMWAVSNIWVMPGWASGHDPDLDFAFLTVSPIRGRQVQAVTGGLRIGFLLGYLQTIEVIGYNDTDNEPVRCLTRSFKFRTNQMEFYCHDYRDGTSGGPWIIGWNPKTGTGTVIGVIGGYEQGGSYEWASYSAYFGVDARSLLAVAEKVSPTPTPTPTTHSLTPTQSPTNSSSPASSPAPSPAASPAQT
jgi:hypothetical protein